MKQTFVPTFVARSNAFPRKGRVTTTRRRAGTSPFNPVSDRLPPLSWNYPSNWIAKGNLVRIRPRPPTRPHPPLADWYRKITRSLSTSAIRDSLFSRRLLLLFAESITGNGVPDLIRRYTLFTSLRAVTRQKFSLSKKKVSPPSSFPSSRVKRFSSWPPEKGLGRGNSSKIFHRGWNAEGIDYMEQSIRNLVAVKAERAVKRRGWFV